MGVAYRLNKDKKKLKRLNYTVNNNLSSSNKYKLVNKSNSITKIDNTKNTSSIANFNNIFRLVLAR